MLRPIFVLSFIVLIPTTALGTTYLIQPNGTGDFPTIQAAIDEANPGDIIQLADGTFTGDGNRDIDYLGKPITVQSQNGNPENCVIDCEGSSSNYHRGFYFHSNEGPDSILEGITITGAWYWSTYPAPSGGGICIIESSPYIMTCILLDNYSSRGGGIFCDTSSSEIEHCVFKDNEAVFGGGILCRESVQILVKDSVFCNNIGETQGGGIDCVYNSDMTVRDCVMYDNYGARGGALNLSVTTQMSVYNCTLNGNGSTQAGAGGIYINHQSNVDCNNTIITNGNGGSAVRCSNGSTVLLSCCDLYNNAAGDWVECVAGQQGLNGNISVDPIFCDPEADDLRLQGNSPCAPDNNPQCGMIGALSVGCGYVPTTYILAADGSGDYPTIQAAVDAAFSGDVIELLDGVFSGDGNRDIDFLGKAITVKSQSEYPALCIIDCEGSEPDQHRAFQLLSNEGADSIIEGLTITGGWRTTSPGERTGGAIRCFASPTINNCIFKNNYADYGGAISTSGEPEITGCRFINNTATVEGGALYANDASPTISFCIFDSNVGAIGNAAYFISDTHATMQNCTITRNNGNPGSASVELRYSCTANIDNTIIAYGLKNSVWSADNSNVQFSCTDIYGNADSDWHNQIIDQLNVNGNISADPIFCDLANVNLYISNESPCNPDNSGGCGLIGALDVGCGQEPVVLPYFEDFEDSIADGFTVVSGEWEVVGGEYRCLNEEPGVKHISTVGDWDWSDYRYEVDLATFGSEIQEVMVRYGSTGNWYLITLASSLSKVFLHKSYNGAETLLLQINDYPNEHEMWHHFTIDVQQATITAYFDDVELFSYTDTTDPLMTGKVGVVSFAWGSIDWQLAYYDNVSVIELGVPETALFEPLPSLSEPISCDETATLNFHYTPAVETPAVKGYSARVVAGNEVMFSGSDILVNSLPPGDDVFYQILENGVNDYTIDYTILGSGTNGITTEEDLFFIAFHGAAEGVANISITEADFRDLDNLNIPIDYSAQASIPVDCGPPQMVTQISSSPSHQYITVTWDEPNDPDLASVSVFRGLWHDGGGSSAYPLYGLLAGSTIPARPVSMQDAIDSDEWELAAFLDPGIGTIVDLLEPRGIYFYEVFAVDEVGNASLPADDNDRATNYWLGDIAPPGGDGYIDIADLSALGDTYGVGSGHGYFNPEADVGPTDDASATGIPLPDGFIDFEDLMICGMNFGEMGPGKVTEIKDQVVVLGWIKESELEWSCQLLEPCNSLKGLHISSVLPAGVTASVSEGELISQQAGPVFLRNVRLVGVDIGMAILGNGLGIQGTGELFRIYLTQEVDLLAAEFDARNVKNSELDIELRYEASDLIPDRFQLSQNYPNPFNPTTTIGFDLPEPQHVNMTIYSVDGRKIRALLSKPMDAGRHSIIWDGKDEQGLAVASGMYFYRIDAGPYQFTKKMALMK